MCVVFAINEERTCLTLLLLHFGHLNRSFSFSYSRKLRINEN